MKRKISWGLLVIIICLLSLCSGYAKLKSSTLEEVIDGSDYIVIGKTVQVLDIEGVTVGELEVIETLKGKTNKHLYYLVKCNFECDTGEAKIGEIAVFFFWKGRNAFFQQTSNFTNQLERVTKGESLLNITRYGAGRMPIRVVLNKSFFYVTLNTYNIILPESFSSIAGPRRRYADFERSISLYQLAKFIRLRVTQQQDIWKLHP